MKLAILGIGFFSGWAWGILLTCFILGDCKGGEKRVGREVDQDRD